jgi:hypothetical protein
MSFLDSAFEIKKNFFNKDDCKKILNLVKKNRDFNKIWISENDFNKNKILKTVNPRPGRNLIEKLDTKFIFSNPKFIELINKILGSKWKVLDYKFVAALEKKMVPNWVQKKIEDTFIPNLGRFVKENYRDITYFRGIDFHQDIIDFPHKKSDFITCYIYIEDVDKNSSPLIVFPKSHIYGAQKFPHKISKVSYKTYKYFKNNKQYMKLKSEELVGKSGTLYFWHPCILHGTQPTIDNKFRVSIRILIEKNQILRSGIIDDVNKNITGRLSLKKSRSDIDNNTGKYLIKGNFINKNY